MRAWRRMNEVLLAGCVVVTGCYAIAPNKGGGTRPPVKAGDRSVDAADVLVPQGYRVEVVAAGFDFPTGVTWDAQGRTYVVESGYAYGEVFGTPRLLRLDGDQRTQIASGDS